MPDFTIIQIILLTTAILVGVLLGWSSRARRSTQQKAAVSAGWQEQIAALRTEGKRLVEQNKALMEQVSQLQASGKDGTNRAKELSAALKEAFARRDQLQREIKDIRSNLEATLAERKRLESDMQDLAVNDGTKTDALREKDDKIFKLSRELDSWHNRLPPLIQRFQERDKDARRLEQELSDARSTIAELENRFDARQTHVESTHSQGLSEALAASNDTIERSVIGDGFEIDSELIEDDPLEDIGEDLSEVFEAVDPPGGRIAGSTGLFSINGADPYPLQPDTGGSGSYPTQQDDLKRIKGVGPAIEKTLHELGIFSFRQIADMNEFEIDRVANQLKGFHSRIYRENWIGQARDLLGEAADQTY